MNITANGAVSVLEKLKHLSAHPAIEPQSSVFFFSHGPLWWQQSLFAAIAASWVMAARAIPPAMGAAATESAMNATRMALKIFMLAKHYLPEVELVKLRDRESALISLGLDGFHRRQISQIC
jgi:hypothetical protein